MPLITLSTDFGLKEGNVGVMKGVILGITPAAQIVDLTHLIAAQDVFEAAFMIGRSAPYFPPGTVHVVVVDPGVGTQRRPMAARLGDQYFVGPDNGIITLLLDRAQKRNWPVAFVHLDKSEFWLPDVSYVFHGRDIFAPVAAHLAGGKTLTDVGTPFENPAVLDIPQPEKTTNGWAGKIVHIDYFGNAVSNIRIEHMAGLFFDDQKFFDPSSGSAAAGKDLAQRSFVDAVLAHKDQYVVRVNGQTVRGVVSTFGERQPGELVSLLGSTGNLIVSVVNGSAARGFDIKVGQDFIVERSA